MQDRKQCDLCKGKQADTEAFEHMNGATYTLCRDCVEMVLQPNPEDGFMSWGVEIAQPEQEIGKMIFDAQYDYSQIKYLYIQEYEYTQTNGEQGKALAIMDALEQDTVTTFSIDKREKAEELVNRYNAKQAEIDRKSCKYTASEILKKLGQLPS